MRKAIYLFSGAICGLLVAVLLFALYGFFFASPHGRGEEHARFWTQVLFLGVMPVGTVLGAAAGLRWATVRSRLPEAKPSMQPPHGHKR